MARNGYLIRKFFLHISKEEQRRRFLSRLEEPDKRWKFMHRGRGGAQAGATTCAPTRT